MTKNKRERIDITKIKNERETKEEIKKIKRKGINKQKKNEKTFLSQSKKIVKEYSE